MPPPPLDLLGSEPGGFRFNRLAGFVETLAAHPPAVNYALLIGHITLDHRVMDRRDRAATAAEIHEMTRQVTAAITAGAIGVSTGLDYPSAVAAPLDEILPLVAAVKPAGGLYCAHHRNYFERLEAALDEALAIGRETGVPLTLSHRQCTGASNFGKGPMTLAVTTAPGGPRPSRWTPIPTRPARRPSIRRAPSPASGSW